MPYNFAAESFHTKKLCSRLPLREVHFYSKNGQFAFGEGGLEATYALHLRVIGNLVVDFLLVIIELFSLFLKQQGQFDPKFQVEGDVPH